MSMPLPVRLAGVLALLLVVACSPPRRIEPRKPPAAAKAVAPSAESRRAAAALQRARGRIEEARRLMPGWTEADALVADAERAQRRGEHARAESLAVEAAARADIALDAHYLALAQLELQKSQVYTGLSDAQLEQVRIAEVALARGEGRRAYELLSKLNQKLAEATQRYVVAAGDSLWVISGRPEVYGNPWLWPLIWQANLEAIPNPNRLLAGQKLKIKPNPTIEEVVQAVEFARESAGRRVRIGEVRQE